MPRPNLPNPKSDGLYSHADAAILIANALAWIADALEADDYITNARIELLDYLTAANVVVQVHSRFRVWTLVSNNVVGADGKVTPLSLIVGYATDPSNPNFLRYIY